jgi:hypothetical protein
MLKKLTPQRSSQSSEISTQTHRERFNKLNTIKLISSSNFLFLKGGIWGTLGDNEHHFATQTPIDPLPVNRRLRDSNYIKSWEKMLIKPTLERSSQSGEKSSQTHCKRIRKLSAIKLISSSFYCFWKGGGFGERSVTFNTIPRHRLQSTYIPLTGD